MTTVKPPHVGWAYIVLVLDWHSKKIVGHSMALRSMIEDWLDALTAAYDQQFLRGAREYRQV